MDYNHDQDMQEVANRMESYKLTRPSKSSTGQTPKRHSARIEKPRSNHQSPRALERRRTLTAVKQYASLDDHYRKMFGLEDEEEREIGQEQHQNTRPVSWHPSSSRWAIDDYIMVTSQSPAQMMYQHSSTSIDASVATYASQVNNAWSSHMHGYPASHQTYGTPSYMSSTSRPESTDHTEYQQVHSLPVRYTTPQDQFWEDDAREDFQREQSTELIGVGLYDLPGTTLPFVHTGGKGMKLEETWQPPEDMEDADADEESEDEEEEPPRPEDAQLPQASLPVVNMSGQSLLFDGEDAGLKNEWWYHQLKNPLPQAGTLRYGWI